MGQDMVIQLAVGIVTTVFGTTCCLGLSQPYLGRLAIWDLLGLYQLCLGATWGHPNYVWGLLGIVPTLFGGCLGLFQLCLGPLGTIPTMIRGYLPVGTV